MRVIVFVMVTPLDSSAAALALSLCPALLKSFRLALDTVILSAVELPAARLKLAEPSVTVFVRVIVLVLPWTLRLTFVLTTAVSVSFPVQLAPVEPVQEIGTPTTPLGETFAVPPIVIDPGPGSGGVVVVAVSDPDPWLVWWVLSPP